MGQQLHRLKPPKMRGAALSLHQSLGRQGMLLLGRQPRAPCRPGTAQEQPHASSAELSGARRRLWQRIGRVPAVSEGGAPLTSEAEAEEQEAFETGVGWVEPVEEDEAEVWGELAGSGLPCWGYSCCHAGELSQLPACCAQIDFLGEPTTGNLHLVQRAASEGAANVLGLRHFDDIFSVPYRLLQQSQQVGSRGPPAHAWDVAACAARSLVTKLCPTCRSSCSR